MSSSTPIPATNLQYITQDITTDAAHLLFFVDANPIVLNDMSPTYLYFLIVPCYYIICFGCLMGFIMHFYIIFGTKLLIEGPVQIVFFAYFSVSQKRNIKRNPNGMKPSRGYFFGTNVIQETWNGRQGSSESVTR